MAFKTLESKDKPAVLFFHVMGVTGMAEGVSR